MTSLAHDHLCPQATDIDGCACSTWLGKMSYFDPARDCERCSCCCDLIARVRAECARPVGQTDFNQHGTGENP